MSVTKFK